MTNREQLERLYGEWARGDLSRSDIYDPDVQSTAHGVWPAERLKRFDGLEELNAGMIEWMRTWAKPATVETDEIREDGDRFCVLMRWRGRGKDSGAPFEAEGAHLWEFREGKAVRFDVYRDREEALAAFRDPSSG